MRHFKRVTSDPPAPGLTNAVIMGRKTWDSIPAKFRPLDGRTNVVLTRQPRDVVLKGTENDSVLSASSLEEAVEMLESVDGVGHVFVVGGGQVYKEAVASGLVSRVLYTAVDGLPADAKFDAFFPELPASEWECAPYGPEDKENGAGQAPPPAADASEAEVHTDAKSGLTYRFLDYRRKAEALEVGPAVANPAEESIPEGADVNPEEMQYLELCQEIIDQGVRRGDRTGTGTLSKFGTQMRFSLRDGTLPLLTTKRTFWRGVAEELLWFVAGNTNANDLADKKIHIWDGNGSREFLNQRGLGHREVGDLGPVYGFQWRHFGAKYVDMHTDYTGKGVDQLAECIEKIKNTPEDRRIIMSAWNPADLDQMALPPCHMFCQFYVDTEKGELSCQMYQRSADMGLGVPFNIASYALLTHMVAHVCGLKAGDFVHTIGDAHVYSNHVDALREQLGRLPRAFPKITINSAKRDIDGFVYDDFKVVGYKPHKTIKMKMAV
jgi:dihydrofolate reductase/thymidylate synthase